MSQFLHLPEGRIRVGLVQANPYYDSLCVPVNITHLLYLDVFLLLISLVDAQSVNLQRAC